MNHQGWRCCEWMKSRLFSGVTCVYVVILVWLRKADIKIDVTYWLCSPSKEPFSVSFQRELAFQWIAPYIWQGVTCFTEVWYIFACFSRFIPSMPYLSTIFSYNIVLNNWQEGNSRLKCASQPHMKGLFQCFVSEELNLFAVQCPREV